MTDTTAPPLPPDWQETDTWASWWLAHDIIGARVKAGGELPEMFKREPAE